MKRFAIGFGGVLLAALVAFFIFAPGYVERDMNVIDGLPLPPVSDEARALHETLTIVDLHGDTLLWKRDMLEAADRGHIDLPRLKEGNVALQVFSSVTKTPRDQNYDNNTAETDNITLLAIGQLQPLRTWTSLLERTLWHGERLERAAAESEGDLALVRTPADIVPVRAPDASSAPVAAMLSVEGLHNLEGDLANLDALYDAGVRMAGLVHFFDNDLAGSMHGIDKGGLTDIGREAVRRMERMGMVVDIAHCSHQCVAEVLAMAQRPVVSSHGGVQATCPVNRNLTDAEIRGLAATGGVIGVGYWEGAVCDTSPAAIVAAMTHIRDLVGIEHVALGSDFDGTVTTRFDAAGLVNVTQGLIDAGFTEEEIRAVMGGNALRVLEAGLEPLA
ncbi:dipeptidase [Aurantiacibacter odishensis]|uniref:dipeptidase n=1 Tax=Aurantiacibacter odishensis TaxID=1155476 RepID=UPI000E72CBAF|nr:dipeptidase [Aurantiacibacter odishensis]